METTKKIIIAIDGYSSTGKSTVAKQLAKYVGYTYIDTGAMYRAVTLFALENKLVQDNRLDEKALISLLDQITIKFKKESNENTVETYLNGENIEAKIRGMEVSNWVSGVATISEVRKRLVKLQQDMGAKKAIVMDGRDIGTVVFPNAELKLFMTASPRIRAERRYKELIEKEAKITYDEVLANVEKRDFIDSTREDSPLKKAPDAYLIDNSTLSHQDQFQTILDLVKKHTKL